jgi:hypothetical protein
VAIIRTTITTSELELPFNVGFDCAKCSIRFLTKHHSMLFLMAQEVIISSSKSVLSFQVGPDDGAKDSIKSILATPFSPYISMYSANDVEENTAFSRSLHRLNKMRA